MSEIRHIVFDIGKVLIHYDPALPYRRLIPDEATRNWFLANVCSSDWNLEQDRGRDWQEAERLLIERHPKYESMIRAFRQHWPEMVSHAYADSVQIFETLIDTGYDVTMLTNFASDTFDAARERFPFLKLPRGVTVSAEVGLLKPDQAIYDLHTSTFDLNPLATLFIDDSLQNIEGAQAAGWRAIQFINAETLRNDLRKFAIDI